MARKTGYEKPDQRVQVPDAAEAKQLTLDKALEKLFNLSLDMLCVADFDGYFRIINVAFENTLGHPRRVLLKIPSIEFVHPDDRAATLAARKQLAGGETVSHFENRYRCRDGSYKWLDWNSVPSIEEGFVYAVARDITEQKAIQQELTSQYDLFDNVLSNVPASIFWKDRNSVYLGVNERFARDAGLQSTQQIIGKSDYDLSWTKEEADFYRECDRKVMDSGEAMLNIEESQQQADGRKIDILTSKVPLLGASGQVNGMLGIYMDISKRKQAETTLQKSEARLQTLFDSAAEFIFVIEPDGVIIQANRYVYAQSGYKAEEVIGSNIRDYMTEESKGICDCNFPGLREDGYSRADIEFVCKDGRVCQMECSATGVADEAGEFTTFLIIQRDVTERKQAAIALANSEQRFRAIFNSTYQFIGVLDTDGLLLEVNQTALDFGGLRQADVVGRPFWDTYWWCYSTQVQDRLKAAIREASRGKPVCYEEDVLARNNTTRTIDFTLKPVFNQHGETVFIIPEGRDITDRKWAQEELHRHHQELAHVIRLSTMGEMASGMAHELNQPLAALVSYTGTAVSLVKSLPAAPPQLLGILERTAEQAQRAGSIIRHLREFVSKERDQKQPLDLDDVIRNLNILLSSELKISKVKLEHRLDGRGHKVLANKVQIEQVLVNLVRNSIEAIQSIPKYSGEVILATQLLKDESIEVTVSDNGAGLDAGMIGKLFNPFQTSKASGMGMGLSISRSIIEDHGGSIWADEKRHNGALFGFRLPVFE
ncbi:MAG: PAS domain S-box protein [Thiogranum sp.]